MKKRIVQTLIVAVISVCFIPLRSSALGGYFAVKGEKTYHAALCDELHGYELENLLWFETERDVKNAGFKQSECCLEYGFDYEQDGDTTLYSKDYKIQSALELERINGIFEGYSAAKDEFYDARYGEGYSAGTSDGKEAGYQDGYDVGYEDGVSSEKPTLISIIFTIGTPCVVAYWIGRSFSNNELGAANIRLKRENDDLKKLLNQNRISND